MKINREKNAPKYCTFKITVKIFLNFENVKSSDVYWMSLVSKKYSKVQFIAAESLRIIIMLFKLEKYEKIQD